MVLKLFGSLGSQPVRAQYIFLKVNNIDFEFIEVEIRRGDHKKEWFLKMNPMHKVPIIDHDGFLLTESAAILSYFAALPGVPNHWYAQDDLRTKARIIEYLSWHPTGLRRGGTLLFQSVVGIFAETRERHGGPKESRDVIIDRYAQDLNVYLNEIEEYFLKDRPFLAGDYITIADIQAACELTQVWALGYPIGQGRPKLDAWYARTKERLQPHFDEAHQKIMKFTADKRYDFNFEARKNWTTQMV